MDTYWQIVTQDGSVFGTYFSLSEAESIRDTLNRDYQSKDYKVIERTV